jgi:hypothetical protein
LRCINFAKHVQQYGHTALIYAAKVGHSECVRQLLVAGADKNVKTNVRGSVHYFFLILYLKNGSIRFSAPVLGLFVTALASHSCVWWWILFESLVCSINYQLNIFAFSPRAIFKLFK